jgi:hypothetical protein
LYPKTKLSSAADPRVGLTSGPSVIFSTLMGNAPDSVKRLVDRFDQNRKVFQSADYKEEQLRAEFLNPFFQSLGWDMDNPLDTIRIRKWASVRLFLQRTCLSKST